MSNDFGIAELFPTPVYHIRRELDLDSSEKKEIEDIIKEGLRENPNNSSSNNTYIFNTKLKNLKEFCEQNIKIYVKEIINPKQELDFYITQSWINVNKPGESHHHHWHSNSIISGVFYISTEEGDKISFSDPNLKLKEIVTFESKEYNVFNSLYWNFPVNNNEFILFPSWINHKVEPNEKATTDRISISFNTFARGIFGDKLDSTELIL